MSTTTENYIIQLYDRFSAPMAKANASTGAMNTKILGLSKNMVKLGAIAAGAMAVIGAGKLMRKGLEAWDKQDQAIAQVRQGLISTGGVAGKTLQELENQAASLQKKTLFGDEDILKGATAQLLTFTNIAGENFDKAQKAALDVTTRLYGADASAESLRSTSIMLGKAINDPVANMGALSRAGIQFSEDQKEVIKGLAETGRLSEAQAILLDELSKQYGGSAEAAAAAGMGYKEQYANQVGDLMEKIGRVWMPIHKKWIQALSWMVNVLENIGTSIYHFVGNAGRELMGFFGGMGAVLDNIGKRLTNTGTRLKNVFYASTGQWGKIQKIEKVGQKLGEAYKTGYDSGVAKVDVKREARAQQMAMNGAGLNVPSIAPGSSGTPGASSKPVSVTGTAPKVFNINIERLNGVETLSTTNLSQSASEIGSLIVRELQESLADVQLSA